MSNKGLKYLKQVTKIMKFFLIISGFKDLPKKIFESNNYIIVNYVLTLSAPEDPWFEYALLTIFQKILQ